MDFTRTQLIVQDIINARGKEPSSLSV